MTLLSDSEPVLTKFPHTRAQLAAIARQHKPLEYQDNEVDGEDYGRITASFVNKVVALLVEDHEDELKDLLKETFGMDDVAVEQNALDLMHKHQDDVAGVPFLFLTAARRPISRPSSRASMHSARLPRPDTPTSAPNSPLAMIFRRPHTPLTSPLASGAAAGSYMSVKSTAGSDYSPLSSPILSHASATYAHAQFTASLPASPLSSPRLLNAKASEFKPIPRPLSAAGNPSSLRAESPDLWAHNSPRASSNLAIAAPLVADRSVLLPSVSRSPSSLRDSYNEEDEDDPFDPFGAKPSPLAFHSIDTPNNDSDVQQWAPDDPAYYGPQPQPASIGDEEANSMLSDGMTPFDVLSSVFGSTLAPSELEEALAASGYDFELAMSSLIERALPQPSNSAPHSPNRIQQMGGRLSVASRDAFVRGGRGFNGPQRGTSRYVNGRPVQSGNRVCRYFVAGECLRADCRFSHDLERALCRFWLRGVCAKNENCEFLHHLPKDVDISRLNMTMSRMQMGPGAASAPPPSNATLSNDDFPTLGYENGRNNAPYAPSNDPGRTRFAAAVKKPAPPVNEKLLAARREVMGLSASDDLHNRSAIVAPKPSPRVKLHPPVLLPTLPTGEAVNSLYMSYRQRALRLGAARNACLSRAADAWRRGDGAAAKRFSREGHDLNEKMSKEMANAAEKLVRERASLTEAVVRGRDQNWSDDPMDRTWRGRICGAGLGVILGVASARDSNAVSGDSKATAEERMEAVLDLHGLHSNEATEVLEEFLLALEQEHFYGLAYAIVGEEKHTGTQDVARGASRARLAAGVREWLHRWGYAWSERDGIICIDPLSHASE
ncbi:hypothetical protein FISHEDRAFT_63549 [Fistulina hepatica ATCC 64428]|uniref:Uncharacterized protein n=1 Tax=Fistulina hepatica ATCC 64428 TaxID=1128425 RepID=A0A0D7ANH3_9AGAR|nr:hypothetical protein FISHEDRAFT_63549 [Fistulina hepatica ATCC 64428]